MKFFPTSLSQKVIKGKLGADASNSVDVLSACPPSSPVPSQWVPTRPPGQGPAQPSPREGTATAQLALRHAAQATPSSATECSLSFLSYKRMLRPLCVHACGCATSISARTRSRTSVLATETMGPNSLCLRHTENNHHLLGKKLHHVLCQDVDCRSSEPLRKAFLHSGSWGRGDQVDVIG